MKDSTPPEPFHEPPELFRKIRFSSMLRYLGPGALIASVTIGSGELVMASRSGAIFGYAMLWCFVYAGAFKAVQVYVSNRHITLTGEHPIMSWRNLPGPPLWFPVFIAVPTILLIPVTFSFLPEMLAGFLHRLFELPLEGKSYMVYGYEEFWLNVWASMLITVCLIMAVASTFDWVERISALVLGVMVLCIFISVCLIGFDIFAVLKGMFLPWVPDYDPWIKNDPLFASVAGRSPWLEVAVYLSAVGGGVESYLGYVSTVREKKWGLSGGDALSKETLEAAVRNPDQLRRAKLWIRAPLMDTVVSFLFVILVTLLFGVLGAAVLHPEQLIPDGGELLTFQERYLTELHPRLSILYRISVFCAFIGTIYGAFVLYRYTVSAGLIGIFGSRLPPSTDAKWKTWVYAYCFLGGLPIIWLPVEFSGSVLDRLTLGGLFTGAFGCGLWCFAMLWSDKTRMPKALQMSTGLKGALLISGGVLLFLGIKAWIAFFS